MEHKLSSNVLCDQWQYQYKVEIISSSSSSSHSIDGAACDFAPTSEVTTFFIESERKFNFQMQTIFSFVILLFYRVVLWDDVEGASSSSRSSSKAINIDDRWRIHGEDEEFFFCYDYRQVFLSNSSAFPFVLAFRDTSLQFRFETFLAHCSIMWIALEEMRHPQTTIDLSARVESWNKKNYSRWNY